MFQVVLAQALAEVVQRAQLEVAFRQILVAEGITYQKVLELLNGEGIERPLQ